MSTRATAKVQVGKIPGEILTLNHRRGETVSELLARADISAASGAEIQVDGQVGSRSSTVTAGATVLVINKIKGN